MDMDPRAALDRFIEALTAHYEVVASNKDPEAPAVVDAMETLEDAFVRYDDALITHYDVDLPFEVYYDEDDEDEDDEDDEDEDDDYDDEASEEDDDL